MCEWYTGVQTIAEKGKETCLKHLGTAEIK